MDYLKAANYWKDKKGAVAPDDVIKSAINQVLSEYRHCTIATASEMGVDATAVHYIYLNEFIYIFSEGGEKFLHLEKNKNVAISVYNSDGDFGNLHSVQIYGKVELVEILSEEYLSVVKKSAYNLHVDYLRKRAEDGEPLYLIKVYPDRYKIIDSDFKKQGYDVNQIL